MPKSIDKYRTCSKHYIILRNINLNVSYLFHTSKFYCQLYKTQFKVGALQTGNREFVNKAGKRLNSVVILPSLRQNKGEATLGPFAPTVTAI